MIPIRARDYRSFAILACLLGVAIPFSRALADGPVWQPYVAFPDDTAPRVEAVGVNHAGTIYALGGSPLRCEFAGPCEDPDRGAADYLSSDGTTWLQGEPFSGRDGRMGAGVDGLGRLVVFGAADPGDTFGDVRAHIYDPLLGVETEPGLADRNFGVTNFAHATDDLGRLYSIGGGPGASASAADPNRAEVERYDSLTDSWEILAPLPEERASACAVDDGQGHVLVIGGYDRLATERSSKVFSYEVSTGIWSHVTDLPEPPSGGSGFTDQRAVLGADGRVYVIGGRNGSVAGGFTQAFVYVLDPVALTWSFGPDMITPRHGFAVALGDDRFIYAMGGDNDDGGTHLVERLETVPDCNENGTPDQFEPDSDGDGVIDDCESCPFVPNPDQADGDEDGIADACDNCPQHANTGQADGDGDGLGDACDNSAFPEYVITDLGALLGSPSSQAWGINDAGHVVGDWSNPADAQLHAFLFDGAMHDLGPGGARAVNASDQVAGYDTEAFLIDFHAETISHLGTLGGSSSSALGLNDLGEVAGVSDMAAPTPDHAFLHSGGSMQDLGTLGDYTIGHDVNEAGLVVGEALVGTWDQYAVPFVYDSTAPEPVMQQLAGPYISGSARAVNSAGHVVGWKSNNDDTWGRAFLHDGALMTDLGSVPGKSYTIATDLNDSDEVVGYAFGEWVYYPCCGMIWSNGIKRAFVHSDGETVNLNTMIHSASGWTLVAANGINDAGQIVGGGFVDGRSSAFLLTPAGSTAPPEVSDPAAATLLAFSDALTLEWEHGAATGSVIFNLYRGELADLGSSTGPVCYRPDLPAPVAEEPESPATGHAWYYVVSGENGAGEGPIGNTTAGTPRVPSVPCP